jgi:MFS family permease
MMFGLGTLASITLLTRRGGLALPGRALVLSMVSGCTSLVPMAFGPPFSLFAACIFFWGMSGGIAMSMSRTILQERAPDTHQSRVMAAHALSSAGGAPLGSVLMGFTVGLVGVRWSVLVPILGVALMTICVITTHAIWRQRSRSLLVSR